MACDCLIVTFREQRESTQVYELTPVGQYLGFDYFEFPFFSGGGGTLTIWYDEASLTWILTNGIVGTLAPSLGTFYDPATQPCPIGIWNITSPKIDDFTISSCEVVCIPIEDRIYREYSAIQLPQVFVEQDRGYKFGCCCEPQLVLAGNGNETWKNDVTSAWIKLSSETDIANFELLKDGIPASYSLTILPFVNEPNAYYVTINWIDVLNSDGIGCYTLNVGYDISGIVNNFTWGEYFLKPYTIDNAKTTCRLRVKFNLKQEIEGINFTDSNVEDTFRFHGFIGERQPNMEIDNLIYQDRQVRSVIRENLNEYTITSDPSLECITRKLTDLYLLSENEMWISDYNANNHSYRYLDIPVIVEKSPEINYIDLQQRLAIVKCVVGDKSKNKRTYY